MTLAKRMKDEAVAHREWKTARTLELSQLKRQQQRTQYELSKITAKADKQDSVPSRGPAAKHILWAPAQPLHDLHSGSIRLALG